MALDLLEAIRPAVEYSILDLLAARHFRRGDFRETRDGRCQLLPPLTHDIADLMPDWARALAPHAEHVTRLLADAADGKVIVRTPLTQANIRTAQDAVRARKRRHRADRAITPAGSCRDCGAPLADRTRQLCKSCWPVARRQLAVDRAAAGRAVRAAAGNPGLDPDAAARKATSLAADRAARAAWAEQGRDPGFDLSHLQQQVIPGLVGVPLGAIGACTGLSVSACSRIRSGTLTPHPRHWEALAQLTAAREGGGHRCGVGAQRAHPRLGGVGTNRNPCWDF